MAKGHEHYCNFPYDECTCNGGPDTDNLEPDDFEEIDDQWAQTDDDECEE